MANPLDSGLLGGYNLPPTFDVTQRPPTTPAPSLSQEWRHLINRMTAGSEGVQPLEFAPNVAEPKTYADITREGWGSPRQGKFYEYGKPGRAWYSIAPGHTTPWAHLGRLAYQKAAPILSKAASIAGRVAGPVGLAAEVISRIDKPKFVEDFLETKEEFGETWAEAQAEFGEDVAKARAAFREKPAVTDFEEQLGYDKADELRRHGEIVRDSRSSPFERSQSSQALRGLIKKIDFGSEKDITKLVGQTWSGVGGDEIPELVYNMPVGVPSEGVSDVTPVVTEDDLRALQANQQVYYADTVEPPTDKQIADSKRNIDRLIKEADKDKPMVSRVSQALTDYAYGEDVGELEAIAALTEADPTFNFEKYLDPTSQEVMDITSQVESFAGIPTVQPGAETPWIPPAPFQDHLDFPSVIPDIVVPPPAEAQAPYVEDFSAIQQADKARQARDRASERARKAEAASAKKERAADKAAVKKAATASRKAEAKREAATKKKAEKQRSALDVASKKALQEHQAWMATQSVRLEKEKKRRQKQGYGVGAIYT
jgi:hypothetical protein